MLNFTALALYDTFVISITKKINLIDQFYVR